MNTIIIFFGENSILETTVVIYFEMDISKL